MIKKRVLAFFTLLLALGVVLAAIQVATYGNITAFAILENPEQVSATNQLAASLSEYKITQNQIQIYITLNDRSGTDQIISLEYYLKDKETLINSGQREIVLEANKDVPYIIIIPIGNLDYPVYFTAKIKSHNEDLTLNQEISTKTASKITGLAISDTTKNLASKTLFLFLSFIFLFFVLRQALRYKESLKEIRRDNQLMEAINGI